MKKILKQIPRLAQQTIAHFIIHGGLERAAALSYTTLLSLVPLMTVIISISSAFSSLTDTVDDRIEAFIFKNFVPASGEAIQNYLSEFAQRASHLGGLGSIALLVVALMLMYAIEQAFNDIWQCRSQRSTLSRLLIYWAILTLGPLLIVGSVLLSSYLMSDTLLLADEKNINLLPILLSHLAFTLLYWLVPHQPVRLLHALISAALAAILFEWVKKAFAWYLKTFPSYEIIYGALATIPIFLLWIYLSWLVVLFGAEITYALSHWQHPQRRQEHDLLQMICVLKQLAQAHQQGIKLKPSQFHCPHALNHLIALQNIGWVDRNRQHQWLLSKDPRQISLYQIYQAAGQSLPPADSALDPEISALLQQAHQCLQQNLSISLDQIAFA